MIDIQIDLDHVIAKLNELEKGIQRKAITTSLIQAAKPITKSVKSRARVQQPGGSGDLHRSINRRMLSRSGKRKLGIERDTVAMIIGPSWKRKGNNSLLKRAAWLEFGTKTIPAEPFMGPALSSTDAEFKQKFYIGLQDFIDRTVRQ